jgi:1,4-alpha-glucan branching enzyme
MTTIDPATLDAVAHGGYHDPHSVLGIHPVGKNTWVVRTRRPLAATVTAVFNGGKRVRLEHLTAGIWEGTVTGPIGSYRIDASYDDGPDYRADDPYRHSPTIGELDLHLIREGRHERLWDVLGSHVRTHEDSHGTAFAVWAPNARAVRVVGDFNGWDGAAHAMRSMGDSGVWELFIPAVGEGTVYKYEIQGPDGQWRLKADPLARRAEVPPATGSVVTASSYRWDDSDWTARRSKSRPVTEPMSIYEVHLGSWRPGLSYRDAADPLIEHVNALGFTHVEFLPLAEHPFGGSWGYQVTGYFLSLIHI